MTNYLVTIWYYDELWKATPNLASEFWWWHAHKHTHIHIPWLWSDDHISGIENWLTSLAGCNISQFTIFFCQFPAFLNGFWQKVHIRMNSRSDHHKNSCKIMLVLCLDLWLSWLTIEFITMISWANFQLVH